MIRTVRTPLLLALTVTLSGCASYGPPEPRSWYSDRYDMSAPYGQDYHRGSYGPRSAADANLVRRIRQLEEELALLRERNESRNQEVRDLIGEVRRLTVASEQVVAALAEQDQPSVPTLAAANPADGGGESTPASVTGRSEALRVRPEPVAAQGGGSSRRVGEMSRVSYQPTPKADRLPAVPDASPEERQFQKMIEKAALATGPESSRPAVSHQRPQGAAEPTRYDVVFYVTTQERLDRLDTFLEEHGITDRFASHRTDSAGNHVYAMFLGSYKDLAYADKRRQEVKDITGGLKAKIVARYPQREA